MKGASETWFRGVHSNIGGNFDGDEGLSSSRKTRIVASSRGNQLVPGTDVYVGLNAYRMVRKK